MSAALLLPVLVILAAEGVGDALLGGVGLAVDAAVASGSRLPLACTSGQLTSVDHALLQLAADQGIQLRYGGDLDDSGLRIAEYMKQSYEAELIAMDTATVLAAGPAPSASPARLGWARRR